MNSFSFDGVTEGEETFLEGLGLKNPFRFSEYEPGTLYTSWCEIQAAFLVFSSMLKAHLIDLSSKAEKRTS